MSNPSFMAMASVVVESMPPLSSTTAIGLADAGTWLFIGTSPKETSRRGSISTALHRQ